MRRAKAFVVLLFTLAGSARLASADPDDERKADTLFNEAKALVLAGKYADACPKLEESQRLDPALGTEFNLADCDEHLGRTATAWRLFVDVEHAARAAGKKEREDKARERASALEPTLSKLRLHGVVAGATVTRDGEAIPAGELDGYALDPGAHVIQVSEPDKKPWQTTVRGAARGMIDVTVPPLEPLIATPATASTGAPIPSQTATTPPGSSGLGTQKVLALVAGGLGVVGVGLGVGFGFASMGKHNDASKVCAVPNPCNDPTAAQAWTDATSAGNVSTVAFIVGGVLLAGGVVLWLLAPHSRESGEGAAQRPRLEVAPQIGAGFYGLGMRGAF